MPGSLETSTNNRVAGAFLNAQYPSEGTINHCKESDKSSDDPVEILRSLSDDTKTEKSTNSNNNTNSGSTLTTTSSNSITYSGPTPPPSGISSKSVPKKPKAEIEKMFETFYQSPSGEFKPTFYNPFEVRHRRRTSRSQFKILERAFMENCKPSATVRKSLAQELNMSARSIQVWFQNRRAKLKTMLKNGKMTDKQMMEYLNQQQNHSKDSEDQDDQDTTQDSPSSFEEDSEGSESENISPQSNEQVTKMTNVFSATERKQPHFPNSSKAIPIIPVNVQGTEMMAFANSYPNQLRNRSYSLPSIQRSPQLPFKQLQEALFGSTNQQQAPQPQQVQQQPEHLHQQLYHQQQQQQQQQPQTYYNPSLNAFQHYYRASNAVMSQVVNCGVNGQGLMPNQGYYGTQGPIQVHFTPLNQAVEYQPIDPNRFRPRSSSFAIGQRNTSSNDISSNTSSTSSSTSYNNNYDFLSAIKEDSPISEYMSIPANSYFDGNEGDSSEMCNHFHSLDLDYFMSSSNNNVNPSDNCYSHSQHGSSHAGSFYSHNSSTNSSLMGSNPNSPILTSETAATSNSNKNYINELDFLPQPTNEILLSTLIDDDHFLN